MRPARPGELIGCDPCMGLEEPTKMTAGRAEPHGELLLVVMIERAVENKLYAAADHLRIGKPDRPAVAVWPAA